MLRRAALTVVCLLGSPQVSSAVEVGSPVVVAPTQYELDLEVDYEAERLRGTARLVMENPSDRVVAEVSLLLYRLLRVEAVVDGAGEALPFTQRVVAFEDFGKLQVNQLLVSLPQALGPGDRTTLEISYAGHLLGYSETGMLYVKDRIDPEFTIVRDDSYAYPQPGYPSFTVNRRAAPWSFTYEAAITVPAELTVANGGRLEARETDGDRITYRYSSLSPSWRMDFAIADYGRLAEGPIRVFYLPGSADGAAGVAKAAERALDLFTQWFGPPPGIAALTFIEIPDGWGSQADVTTVIQTSAAFRDPERHREVYHEISHLWNVAPTERPSPRWDEGLASFLEYLVTEEVTGRPVVDARADRLLEWLRESLPNRPRWRQVPMIGYGRDQLTDLSYSVGALFFDLLYRIVGRERFEGMIAEFVGGGTTTEFLDLVRTRSPIDLTRFLEEWVLTTLWADRIEQYETIEALAEFYRGDPSASLPPAF